jgi:hypothetical protein
MLRSPTPSLWILLIFQTGTDVDFVELKTYATSGFFKQANTESPNEGVLPAAWLSCTLFCLDGQNVCTSQGHTKTKAVRANVSLYLSWSLRGPL